MTDYQKRYGNTEDEEVEKFHKSRRMFCIKDGELHIAKPDVPYSHAVWFEKEGWMNEDGDSFMDETARGVVYGDGEIRFYVDYDFQITSEAESEFFEHLGELVQKLKIKPSAKVTDGQKKTKSKVWPAIKFYGTVGELLKK